MASATALLVNAEASCRPGMEMELFNQDEVKMSGHPDGEVGAEGVGSPCEPVSKDTTCGTASESSTVPYGEQGGIDSTMPSQEVNSSGDSGEEKETLAKTDESLNNDSGATENSESPALVEAKTWNPLEEVDSALLSALCDSKERKGLLRLERVLVDFMKEGTLGYIEVGGPYNAVVVGGDNENTTQVAGIISQQYTPDSQYQQQQQRGMRQTSFQRLVLHRLADRFNIVRENIANNGSDGASNFNAANGHAVYGGNAGQSLYPPGMIRLVKVKESCIPAKLLIDIDLSILVNYKNPRARAGAGIGGSNYDDGVKNVTSSFASSTLKDGPSTGGSSGKSKSKKKMIIMKRDSSGGGSSHNEANGQGKREGRTRSGLKGKKLSDREKAYEEARARIFGISESSVSESNSSCAPGDKGDTSHAQPTETSPENGASLTECHSSFSSANEVASVTVADVGVGVDMTQKPEANEPVPTSAPIEPTSTSSDLQDQAPQPSEDPSRQSSTSPSSVPAAAKTGAVLKAVYRNRQQEENDPDFRRRSDVRPGYVAMGGMSYGPYGGYNMNSAMGQPSNAAAMMQSQQPHHQYFYGQPTPVFHPNAQATPQDSAYPSMSSQPHSPQYFAPPQAYYPHTGQEKHPQTRQRSNSRQTQPKVANGTSKQVLLKPSQVVTGATSDGASKVDLASKGDDNAVLYSPEDFPALS